jgi:hypothetical protein
VALEIGSHLQKAGHGDRPLSFDWTEVSTWAAMITGLAAVGSVWVQNNSTRTTLSVDLIFRLNGEFESSRAKDHRREAAAGLLRAEVRSQLYSVMDFFDGAGLLLRRKAIHEDILFENFAQAPLCYWFSAKTALEKAGNGVGDYGNYAYLVERHLKYAKRVGRDADALHDEDHIREFLTEESNLF